MGLAMAEMKEHRVRCFRERPKPEEGGQGQAARQHGSWPAVALALAPCGSGPNSCLSSRRLVVRF
jgi:hypothetical protein